MVTTRRSKTTIPVVPIGVLVAVISFWWATPYVIEKYFGIYNLECKGQFGDIFGSVNALFSGLAFFGVVYALYLQRKEIHAQKAEIAATKSIQRETVEALVHSMYANSFAKVYDILDDESVIAARHFVNALGETPYKDWKARSDWEDSEKKIKTLLRAYNIAGIIVRRGFLPPKYVISDWEPSLRSTWNTLAPYVEEQRRLRGSDNHWDNYEWLVKEAEVYVAGKAQQAH